VVPTSTHTILSQTNRRGNLGGGGAPDSSFSKKVINLLKWRFLSEMRVPTLCIL